MITRFRQLISILLLPALLIDPSWSAGVLSHPSQRLTQTTQFQSEALLLPLVTPLHAYAQSSASSVRQQAAQLTVAPDPVWPSLVAWEALLTLSTLGAAVGLRYLYRRIQKSDPGKPRASSRTLKPIPPLQFQVKKTTVFIHRPDDNPVDPIMNVWTYFEEGSGFLKTRQANIKTILHAFEIPNEAHISQIGLSGLPVLPTLYIPESDQAFIWHHTGGDLWHAFHTLRTMKDILQRLAPGGILIYFQTSEDELSNTLNLAIDRYELPFSEVHILYPGTDAPLEVPVAVFIKAGAKPMQDPPYWRRILGILLPLLLIANPLLAAPAHMAQALPTLPSHWIEIALLASSALALGSLWDFHSSRASDPATVEQRVEKLLEPVNAMEHSELIHTIEDWKSALGKTFEAETIARHEATGQERNTLLAKTFHNRSLAYFKLGQTVEAIASNEQSAEAAQGTPLPLRLHLARYIIFGVLQTQTGQFAAAQRTFQTGLDLANSLLKPPLVRPADPHQLILDLDWESLRSGQGRIYKAIRSTTRMQRDYLKSAVPNATLEWAKKELHVDIASEDHSYPVWFHLLRSGLIIEHHKEDPVMLARAYADTEQLFERAEEHPEWAADILAGALLNRSSVCYFRGDIPQALDVTRRGIEQLDHRPVRLEYRLRLKLKEAVLLSELEQAEPAKEIFQQVLGVIEVALKKPKRFSWKGTWAIPSLEYAALATRNAKTHQALIDMLNQQKSTALQLLEEDTPDSPDRTGTPEPSANPSASKGLSRKAMKKAAKAAEASTAQPLTITPVLQQASSVAPPSATIIPKPRQASAKKPASATTARQAAPRTVSITEALSSGFKALRENHLGLAKESLARADRLLQSEVAAHIPHSITTTRQRLHEKILQAERWKEIQLLMMWGTRPGQGVAEWLQARKYVDLSQKTASAELQSITSPQDLMSKLVLPLAFPKETHEHHAFLLARLFSDHVPFSDLLADAKMSDEPETVTRPLQESPMAFTGIPLRLRITRDLAPFLTPQVLWDALTGHNPSTLGQMAHSTEALAEGVLDYVLPMLHEEHRLSVASAFTRANDKRPYTLLHAIIDLTLRFADVTLSPRDSQYMAELFASRLSDAELLSELEIFLDTAKDVLRPEESSTHRSVLERAA